MIRFVEMTGIYLDETKSFGFYNTVNDVFLNFGGSQTFDSYEEFLEQKRWLTESLFDRLCGLIPEHWKTN